VIAVEEARDRILAAFAPLPGEVVGIAEAFGRVLAGDVAARLDRPRDALSAMDGYAVRAADTGSAPVSLEVIAEIPAGGRFDGEIGSGRCARIFTGAPLPAGADAVVIQENTGALPDGRIEIREAVAPGRHVRPPGQDFRQGDVLLTAGHCLTARDIGLAAAMNRPWLSVRRRPRITLLATGDELVRPGEPLGRDGILSVNTLALAALVTACGGVPVDLGVAPDDRTSLRTLAEAAGGADVLVTSGGASVGKHDLIREVLGAGGADIDFWRIAMRPGKPLMFGRFAGVPLLGLPGNPVSAQICALLFLRPILFRLQGLAAEPIAPPTARLGCALPGNDARRDFLRARFARDGNGSLQVTPFPVQDSAMLAPLAAADALIDRAPHAPPAAPGDTVPVLLFPPGHQQL
jgi:molybdopterin molybdotransferase